MSKLIRSGLILLCFCFCSLSFAQMEWSPAMPDGTYNPTPPPAAAAPDGETCSAASGMITSLDPGRNPMINNIISFFFGGNANATNRMIAAGRSIAGGPVKTMALQVGGLLALISILFAAITAAIEGRSIAGDVFDVILKAAVIAALISQYDAIVGAGLEQLGRGLTTISGDATPGDILGNFLNTVLRAVLSPIVLAINRLGCTGFWRLGLGTILEMLVVVLITIVSMVILILALVEALFGLLAGPIILAIAIAVGPLSIACANHSRTSAATDKWLSFAISGALMTGIAGIVLRIFAVSLVSTVDPASTGAGGLISASFVVLVNVLIAGKIFSHIPDYAAALSPGSGSGTKGKPGAGKPLAAAGAAAVGAAYGAVAATGTAAKAGLAQGTATYTSLAGGGGNPGAAVNKGIGAFAGSLGSQAKDKIISSFKSASGKKKS